MLVQQNLSLLNLNILIFQLMEYIYICLLYALKIRKDHISHYHELSFYLWAVALALAMTVTTRSIMHSEVSFATEICLFVVSLASCLFQFYFGRKIGKRFNDQVTAGQSLGQKNTVLAIWMGYTFFTPITSIAGGFYSIWHNVINSYQLYRKRKENTN